MRLLSFLSALLFTACCCPLDLSSRDEPVAAPALSAAPVPAPTAVAYDAAYVDAHLARLRAAAGCDGVQHPELGVFCPAVTGWSTGTTAPFSVGSVARLGVTTWVPTVGDVTTAFAAERRFSVLAVTSAGPRANIVSPSAGDPFDSGPATAMGSVLAHLRGTQAAPIPLPYGVHAFVVGRADAPEHPLATTPSGWQVQGGSFADLRRVGEQWIAVEVPRQNPQGLYFSVFVDAAYEARL